MLVIASDTCAFIQQSKEKKRRLLPLPTHQILIPILQPWRVLTFSLLPLHRRAPHPAVPQQPAAVAQVASASLLLPPCCRPPTGPGWTSTSSRPSRRGAPAVWPPRHRRSLHPSSTASTKSSKEQGKIPMLGVESCEYSDF